MTFLIADDHPLVGVSLTYHITTFLPDVTVLVRETFTDVLTTIEQHEVDLIVLDIDIPGSENTQMIQLIRQKRSQVLILMYSGLDEQLYALPYLLAGADGFLSKNAPLSEITRALMTLLDKRKYSSPLVQQLWLSKLGENPLRLLENPLKALSKQEKLIAYLMMDGKWTKEIATLLNLKSNTISTYKNRIFKKLAVSNAAELIQKINVYKRL